MDKFIGQEHWVSFFRTVMHERRLANAYLFSGPRNVGKKTFVFDLARQVLCLKGGVSTQRCDQCVSCRAWRESADKKKEKRHPDLVVLPEVTDKQTISIDTVREFIRTLGSTPAVASYRVAIIKDLSRLTVQSFNLLLKTLEEPPSYVVLFLLTDSPRQLPATVRSRLAHCRLARVPQTILSSALKKRGLSVSEAGELSALSDGRPGLALEWIRDAKKLSSYQDEGSRLLLLCRSNRGAQFSFTETVAKDTQISRLALTGLLDHWLVVLRDLLLTATNQPQLVVHRYLMNDLKKLAESSDEQHWLQVIKSLNEAKNRIQNYGNRRLALNTFFLNI